MQGDGIWSTPQEAEKDYTYDYSSEEDEEYYSDTDSEAGMGKQLGCTAKAGAAAPIFPPVAPNKKQAPAAPSFPPPSHLLVPPREVREKQYRQEEQHQ